MQIEIIFLFAIIPYLIGSIPFGLILGKLFGYGDIRKIGSGNIGATNALRTGNKWLGGLTLFCDMLKGVIAVFLVKLFAPNLIYIAGILAIIGHIFPIWLKFKGGKGVATAIGVLLAINPIIALVLIGVWIATFFITRISSLSALSGFLGATIFAFFYEIDLSAYTLIITIIIFITHRHNIIRLIKGEEHKWSKK